MDYSSQASLSITNSQGLLKLISVESVMPSNHLMLCCPILLPPSIIPSIRVFSNESVHIRWPKYWSFSFNISPSNEHPGLIFRIDWLDLLAVQGTLKSLFQHHSSKASILQLPEGWKEKVGVGPWLRPCGREMGWKRPSNRRILTTATGHQCLNLPSPKAPEIKSSPTAALWASLCVFSKPVSFRKTCLFLCSHVFLPGRPPPPIQASCSIFCVSSALYYPTFHTRFILDWPVSFLFY